MPESLSINDVAHAFYLMKAFVRYPKNFAGLKFKGGEAEENKQLERERELIIQIWNMLQPESFIARYNNQVSSRLPK